MLTLPRGHNPTSLLLRTPQVQHQPDLTAEVLWVGSWALQHPHRKQQHWEGVERHLLQNGVLPQLISKNLIIAHAKGKVSLLSTQNWSFSTSAPHLTSSDRFGNVLLPSCPFSTAYFLRALGRKDLPVPSLKIPGASVLLSKVCARVSKSHAPCKNIYFFLSLKGKDKFPQAEAQ